MFHDPLTPINVSGLLVTIASIAAYNYMKIMKMRREAQEKLSEGAEREGEAGGMLDVREQGAERTGRSTVLGAVRESLTLVTPGTAGGGEGQERQSPMKSAADRE